MTTAAERAPAILGPGGYQTMDIDRFRGGDRLNENCTACHRGSNAFVVFPTVRLQPSGQTLSRLLPTNDRNHRASGLYIPVGQADWTNPAMERGLADTVRQSDCGNSCHEYQDRQLGALTAEFCELIYETMLPISPTGATPRTLMPPSYQAADFPAYVGTISAILQACATAPRVMPQP